MGWWTISDCNSGYFAYSAGWNHITGSTRQNDAGAHRTDTVGATATFRFAGIGVRVVGTVPVGPGLAVFEVQIDNGTPVRITRQSSTEAVYRDIFYEAAQGTLRSGEHTVVVRNLGTAADLQLDWIEWFPTDDPASETPLPPIVVPVAPTTTTTTSTTQTTTSTTSTTPTTTRTTTGTTTTSSSTSSNTSSTGTSSSRSSSGRPSTSTVTSLTTNADGSTNTLVLVVTENSTATQSSDANALGASKNPGGLSKTAIGLITAGSIAFLALVAFLAFLLLRRRRMRRKELEKPMRQSMWFTPNGGGAGAFSRLPEGSESAASLGYGRPYDGTNPFYRSNPNAGPDLSIHKPPLHIPSSSSLNRAPTTSTMGNASTSRSGRSSPESSSHGEGYLGRSHSNSAHGYDAQMRRRNLSSDLRDPSTPGARDFEYPVINSEHWAGMTFSPIGFGPGGDPFAGGAPQMMAMGAGVGEAIAPPPSYHATLLAQAGPSGSRDADQQVGDSEEGSSESQAVASASGKRTVATE